MSCNSATEELHPHTTEQTRHGPALTTTFISTHPLNQGDTLNGGGYSQTFTTVNNGKHLDPKYKPAALERGEGSEWALRRWHCCNKPSLLQSQDRALQCVTGPSHSVSLQWSLSTDRVFLLSLAAGLMAGMLQGQDSDTCVKMGLLAADMSLRSHDPVSPALSSTTVSPEQVRARRWPPVTWQWPGWTSTAAASLPLLTPQLHVSFIEDYVLLLWEMDPCREQTCTSLSFIEISQQ